MKFKLITAAVFLALLYSCSPKVAVTAQQPDPVQVPPKVAAAAPTTLTAELAAGKDLYDNSCAGCHKLFAPTDYSMNDWRPILARMQKKARLDDSQMGLIANYINSQL